MCPKGCEITANLHTEDGKRTIHEILGNQCEKGFDYVSSELTHPVRNIASSVLIKDGELPLASVRLTKPIPKEMIFPLMAELKKLVLTAPVHEGQVVLEKVFGYDSNLMITKDVERISK